MDGSNPRMAPRRRPLVSLAYPGLLVGLALFTAVLAYQGVAEVGRALAVAGWGLLVIAAFHVLPMAADAVASWHLLPPDSKLGLRTLLWVRWLGESVNQLLPVAQIGGNVVRAQMLARAGVPGAAATANALVDMTLMAFSQLVFTLVGLALLTAHVGSRDLTTVVLIGLALMGPAVGLFYAIQRRGLFGGLARVADWFARGGVPLVQTAGAFDAAVDRLYHDRRAIGAAVFWHLVGWVVGVGEVWIGLHFLGHPISLLDAVLLESLAQAVSAAAFAVPGALGVQEGGFLMIGAVIGVPPTTAVALSLAKRVRQLVLGVPGLVAWQLETAGARFRNPHPAREEQRT